MSDSDLNKINGAGTGVFTYHKYLYINFKNENHKPVCFDQ